MRIRRLTKVDAGLELSCVESMHISAMVPTEPSKLVKQGKVKAGIELMGAVAQATGAEVVESDASESSASGSDSI
jgi:hypothetical protein